MPTDPAARTPSRSTRASASWRRLECLQIEVMLERKRSGLSEPDLLLIEEHLAGCDRCAHNARHLERLIALSDRMAAGTSSTASRAIERALAIPVSAPREPRRRRRTALAGGLVFAGVVVAVLLFSRSPAPDPGPSADPIADQPSLARKLAHAHVRVSPDAEIQWHEPELLLRLISGSVHVEVDAKRGLPFRVATEKFRVATLGAEFSADPAGVRVESGEVEVIGSDGREILRGGEAWPKLEPPRERNKSPPAAPDPRAVLVTARRELAERNVDEARRRIQSVLDGDPARADEAEALTLLAECALVAGDRDGAFRMYREVASRFEDLAAGETASFAAARLGPDREARRLLERSGNWIRGAIIDGDLSVIGSDAGVSFCRVTGNATVEGSRARLLANELCGGAALMGSGLVALGNYGVPL